MFFNRYIYATCLILNLVSCTHLKTGDYSPKSDLYWTDLVVSANKENKSLLIKLKEKNADLYMQLLNDSKDSELLNFWGQSLNFDAGAKKKILDDRFISELQGLFGIII